MTELPKIPISLRVRMLFDRRLRDEVRLARRSCEFYGRIMSEIVGKMQASDIHKDAAKIRRLGPQLIHVRSRLIREIKHFDSLINSRCQFQNNKQLQKSTHK